MGEWFGPTVARRADPLGGLFPGEGGPEVPTCPPTPVRNTLAAASQPPGDAPATEARVRERGAVWRGWGRCLDEMAILPSPVCDHRGKGRKIDARGLISRSARHGWSAGWLVAQGQGRRTQRTAPRVMPGAVAAMRGATGCADPVGSVRRPINTRETAPSVLPESASRSFCSHCYRRPQIARLLGMGADAVDPRKSQREGLPLSALRSRRVAILALVAMASVITLSIPRWSR